jgi:transcriptional regulator with XRE-family HTH domain
MATMTKHKPGRERLSPDVFRLWREQMGYSQRDAALALGCSREALGGWETGRHAIPIYIGLAMNALALGMSPYGQMDGAEGDA